MSPVIQSGERVGDREPLQLALTLALPQAGHEVLEHLRQRAHLAASGRGDLDREIARGDFRRRDRQALDRTHHEQADVGHQACSRQQQEQRHAGAAPGAPGPAERLRAWHLDHRRPAERRYAPQGADDISPIRAFVLHDRAFPIDERLRSRGRELGPHHLCRAAPRPQDQPALLVHQVDIARRCRMSATERRLTFARRAPTERPSAWRIGTASASAAFPSPASQ